MNFSFMPQSNRDRLVLLLTLILLFSGMSMDIYIPALPFITKAFGTTVEMTGYTLSAFIIGSSISALIAGVTSDRFGRKPVLFFSNILFIISTGFVVFSPTITFFITARALQGFAAGFYSIVTRQIIKDLFTEKEQININSIMFTAFVISPAIAPIIGAYITEYISWRACFVVIFVLQVFVCRQIHKHLRETIPALSPFPHPFTFAGSFFMFFLNKEFNAAVLISSLGFGGYFAFITISSFIFINHLGFSQIQYSTIFMLLAALYLLANYLMRLLNNRNVSKYKIILYGCVLNYVGALLLLPFFISSNRIYLACVIIVSAVFMRFGLGFMLSLVQIIAMNTFKKNGGQALGAMGFIQSLFAGYTASWVTGFDNSIIGLLVVSLVFNGGALIVHRFLFSNINYPNLKYKVMKTMLHEEYLRKYLR